MLKYSHYVYHQLHRYKRDFHWFHDTSDKFIPGNDNASALGSKKCHRYKRHRWWIIASVIVIWEKRLFRDFHWFHDTSDKFIPSNDNASALGSKNAYFSLLILVLWAMGPPHTLPLKEKSVLSCTDKYGIVKDETSHPCLQRTGPYQRTQLYRYTMCSSWGPGPYCWAHSVCLLYTYTVFAL